jgi:hypothetical protein
MTKEEARAKFPRDHLYWHTAQRCWDNNSARRATRKRINHDPNGNDAGKLAAQKPVIALAKADPSVIWPPVIVTPKIVNADLYNIASITQWPLLIDIDEVTSAQADPPDECCWPDLTELTAFEKRWDSVPVAWRTK